MSVSDIVHELARQFESDLFVWGCGKCFVLCEAIKQWNKARRRRVKNGLNEKMCISRRRRWKILTDMRKAKPRHKSLFFLAITSQKLAVNCNFNGIFGHYKVNQKVKGHTDIPEQITIHSHIKTREKNEIIVCVQCMHDRWYVAASILFYLLSKIIQKVIGKRHMKSKKQLWQLWLFT